MSASLIKQDRPKDRQRMRNRGREIKVVRCRVRVSTHTDDVHFSGVPQCGGVDVVFDERKERLLYLQYVREHQRNSFKTTKSKIIGHSRAMKFTGQCRMSCILLASQLQISNLQPNHGYED